MEAAKFLKLLHRYRFVLMAVPVIAVLLAYFLMRNLPDLYLAETDLSTGIVDPTQQVLSNADAVIAESKVSQQFSNLLQTIRLGKVTGQVSYSLIIHDLSSKRPFRPENKLLRQLNSNAREHALLIFQTKLYNREQLDLTNPDQAGLQKVLEAQKYDAENLKKELTVYRIENSDFIHLDFTSEQPQLSAFVLNSLCKELIAYITADQQKNKGNANQFLEKLVKQKLDTMNAKVAALRNYKIKNHILNLKDQSTSIYSQLNEYRDHKAQAEKDILSYNSAIANINSRFNPNDRRYLEASTVKINGQIAQTRDQLTAVNNRYVQNNFDARYKKSSDSLQNVMDAQISQMSDKYVTNPLAGKESLVQEKVKMEINRDMTRSGLQKLDNQISQLNQQLDLIVPYDAEIQSYERDIDVAGKEYLDVQNKYNQSSIESNIKNTLKQVETAMPGVKQPSKKLLLVLFSGVLSEVFCLVLLFVLFYLNRAISTPLDLANATGLPVLGELSLRTNPQVDFKLISINQQSSDELQQFKNQLRSIRYEVESELNGNYTSVEKTEGKVLTITSLNLGEGKSLVTMNLASAYAMSNKRVLVVDGNFDHPSITKAATDKTYIEDFLKDEEAAVQFCNCNRISVIGNRGGDQSLLEKSSERIIRKKINRFKKTFDVILIETPALSLMNKAKEWIQFADKVIVVFEAGQQIDPKKQIHLNYLHNLTDKVIGLVMNKVSINKELEVKQV